MVVQCDFVVVAVACHRSWWLEVYSYFCLLVGYELCFEGDFKVSCITVEEKVVKGGDSEDNEVGCVGQKKKFWWWVM